MWLALLKLRLSNRAALVKPKLTARQAKIAQAMYDEVGPDGRRAHTVQQIAEEFGVTRPTIYRYLQPSSTGRNPAAGAPTL